MLRKVVTKTLATADDDGIAASQAVAGAGNLTLNGAFPAAETGGKNLLTGRHVIITSAGNDSGITFTIYGTVNGIPRIETIAGAAVGIAESQLNYDIVTRIAASGAAAGNVKAGTNGVGASEWQAVDVDLTPFVLAIAADVTGTINYTIQYTYDDFWTVPTQPGGASSISQAWPDPILAGETTDGDTTYNDPITGWRVLVNSGTGSVEVTAVQAG